MKKIDIRSRYERMSFELPSIFKVETLTAVSMVTFSWYRKLMRPKLSAFFPFSTERNLIRAHAPIGSINLALSGVYANLYTPSSTLPVSGKDIGREGKRKKRRVDHLAFRSKWCMYGRAVR